MQSGQSIRGPSSATAGGSVEIELGTGGDITVNFGDPNDSEIIPVPAGGKISIPIPPSAGQWMTIAIGEGLDRKFLIIEIISPTP